MATTTTQKKPCSKCDKGSGIFTCDGCEKSFCRKHSNEHRQELAIEMDNIGQEHDALQRDINKEVDTHPFLIRIDTWERESIDKIQQVAKQARADFNQVINQKKEELQIIMGKLMNELQSNKESEDYTEVDLKKWINQLSELRQNLEQSVNTYLLDEDDERSVIHLIKINTSPQQMCSSSKSIETLTNQNAMIVNGEKFMKGDKEIEIAENNLVATRSGPKLSRSAVVFGSNHYSIGTHRIRFRIEKTIDMLFFLGIVTHSQMNPSSVFSSSSTNGWWPTEFAVKNGTAEKKFPTINIFENDEITMTLNCDEKIISYDHQRTQKNVQLSIDIQKCPFPWQLVVGLYGIGNCIRILS